MRLAPPYGIIYSACKSGKVVPFVGAGASFLARPNPGTPWDEDSDFPPSGLELSRFLAGKAGMRGSAECADLARVASYYSALSPEPEFLDSELWDIFNRPSVPGQVHRLVAELPQPMLVVTTNYDALIERAFDEAGHEYDVVVHSTSPEIRGSVLLRKHGKSLPKSVETALLAKEVDLSSKTLIYKMHGSAYQMPRSNGFVIKEEDYVDFLARINSPPLVIPPVFTEHMSARSFLFLGYGLRDWNLRVVLKNLSGFLPAKANSESVFGLEEPRQQDRSRKKHWAIQRDPTFVDRTLWQARDVNIFDVDLDEFSKCLLREAPRKKSGLF